jgi:hypothetical protein
MKIPAEVVNLMLGKLSDSIIFVFQWAALLPVIAFVFVLMMGRARLIVGQQGQQGAPGSGPQGAGGTGKPDPSYQKG